MGSRLNERINIRDANENDLNSINEIYNYYITNTTATAEETVETLSDRIKWFNGLKANRLPVIVAEINDRVIGWGCVFLFNDRSGYRFCGEDSVYIDKNYISYGIGTTIMTELIARAKNYGLKVILSKISSEQQKSIEFHRKFGFKEVGLLENVVLKFNRWIGISIMQKNL